MQPGNQLKTPANMQVDVREDRYSYLLMFCALLMVRNSRASLAESLELIPLSPRVSDLAGELTGGQNPQARDSQPPAAGAASGN